MNVPITRVNISSPHGCQVKTEKCENDAYWFIGKKSVCDKHFKELCEKVGWNYEKIVEEAWEGG